MYMTPTASVRDGYAFRYGNWKLAVGGISCDPESATFNCSAPQLYDMSNDIEESHDLALKEPAVLAAIMKNFSIWHESILFSMANESKCSPGGGGHHGGGGGGHAPFPKNPKASDKCSYEAGMRQAGSDIATGTTGTKEECCGACLATKGCGAADFAEASARHPTWNGKMTGGECHLKSSSAPSRSGPPRRG